MIIKWIFKNDPEDDKTDMGEKIKLIGRWHDIANSKGVVIFEADDLETISNWVLNWNSNGFGIITCYGC